ncbi:VOC family protein [Thetidibacter halocola]|uniref:VOC family protein n=1 Tax=Thetidibacter halocola TaxID=2827239 RepID=A0A8J7WF26_9RHOB|nr:VOC family protein [Thetidibacter halocola]MBS0125204.1 VOC family protein [Thetidibacter halocola]
MLELDHIAVLGESLEEAVAHVEQALNWPMQPGGQHLRFATHNSLLGIHPGLYIEAIAADPGLPHPARPRWFGLDSFHGPPRLDKWVLRTPDLDRTLKAFPMAGEIVSLERGDLRWRMAVPLDGMLPFDGVFPALMEWQVSVPPGKSLTKADRRLERLVVTHPEADRLSALLEPHLDAPLVAFEAGTPGLAAEIATAGGTVWLR